MAEKRDGEGSGAAAKAPPPLHGGSDEDGGRRDEPKAKRPEGEERREEERREPEETLHAAREKGEPPDPDALGERPWHAASRQDAIDALKTDPEKGLGEDEAGRRRERYGPNKLPEKKRDTILQVILRQFKDPLIYVLLAAGTVSLLVGNFEDAAFIFLVLAFNAGLGAYQEYKAESAAESLGQVMRITANVVRGGDTREVDAEEVVPGDLIAIASGASVPADIRLLRATDLKADESLLTGESMAVEKKAQADIEAGAPLGDRATLLHAGSTVTSGRARGVAVRTGVQAEVGRIAESLAEEGGEPPLVIRIRRFTRIIAVAVLVIIVVLGGAQALRGEDLFDIFLLAVALAVSAIPAGLPVAITVALSIGSNRMAARNVIVRKLPAVEGLGACTLIASDKTGTLTENKLSARRIRFLDEDDVTVSGAGDRLDGGLQRDDAGVSLEDDERLRRLVVSGALCNEGRIRVDNGEVEGSGDTVDIAFLVLAGKAGLRRADLLEEHEEIGDIPFESERRYAATFNRHGDRIVAHVKGAAQTLVELCDVDADAVSKAEKALADEGYRVIAVAEGPVDEAAAREADPAALRGLAFLGLVGLIDPVRESVPDAVERCRHAGIDVRMVTGDHPSTALAIGRRLAIAEDEDDVLTGAEIGRREEGASGRAGAILGSAIYARIEPRQKTTIVEALQDAGHFVAVTGDGVNDAPALRRANIGVAMGKSGTDVARGAADLILTDDNFASIVNGVTEGRIAYDNVRKVVWLLISTGVAELILFTLSVIFDTPLPLTPVQLLWLNLVTNGIQDVALAFEKGEPDVLERRPRRPDERIFNRLMIEEVATSGVYMGLVSFAVFWFAYYELNMTLFEAQNLLLLLMVLFENVHAFNVRSETRSAFRIPLRDNRLLVGAVVLAQGVHILSMFIPGWNEILDIAPVSLATWGTLLAIAASKFVAVELYKWLRGRDLARRLNEEPTGFEKRRQERRAA
ncbi:HAD-IC family P-type ATPase [Salinarimonas sp.]|uniref:cation-translocating P-type ATPase n=1 Tax=Salinarimonas sp. TaxID=2766526 RepID=UPI0032D912A4